MIIINEYDYVKNIIETKNIPKDISNKRLLIYIAKYFFDDKLTKQEYKNVIFEEMKKFELPLNHYQEYKYDSYVTGLCEKLLSGELSHELRKIDSVDIYRSELDIIEQGESDKEKKLLFTLFVLAKINGTNSGWVNNEAKDIFSLANVTATIKDRSLMIHKLYKAGLIGQTHKNDKLGYKVNIGVDVENIVISINSFENIGNQYIANFKSGWKMCVCCGKLFKTKGTNSKYCKACAREKELLSKEQRNKKYYDTHREN